MRDGELSTRAEDPAGTASEGAPGPVPRRQPWVAVAILSLSLLAWLGFQSVQLARERHNLRAALVSQEPTIQQAQRVRAQVDAVLKDLVGLAQRGNPGAASIVEQLARRGITITPGSGAVGPAPPAPGAKP
ncbi:MAG: hypothetical protein HY294_16705 [Candidatus Rokubacteria bacterium]|nr:hypothetical protein [Candidatus Rokubacteria bacterium]